MARKRGGLAGVWDRNKGAIKAIAPAALSFVPGVGIPLAAAAGAAMGGFDRPGKSGIGFDPFAGMKEGVKAGAIAAGTQGARAMLTGGGQFGSGSGLLNQAPKINPVNLSRTAMQAPGMAGQAMGAANAASAAGNAANATQSLGRVGSLLKGVRDNKDLIGMGAKGLMSQMPNQRDEANLMEAETGRMRFEEEQRQMQIEQERKRRIAELLMPMARQNFPGYFGNG